MLPPVGESGMSRELSRHVSVIADVLNESRGCCLPGVPRGFCLLTQDANKVLALPESTWRCGGRWVSSARRHKLGFDPPLPKCYKSTTSERRVPSVQGPCPEYSSKRRAALWFQVSVPSTKWGFLVVWQAPSRRASNHQAYWCAGKACPGR